jgi:catechol 2,3-dioxygenase-like lactoylglutathione lyase family enzyme
VSTESGNGAMAARALDHVALWVAERDRLADFLCGHLGLHVIERTDAFTLVGAEARRGKLTLFAAEGPRDPGALARVVLRVSDLDRALGELPDDVPIERPADDLALFEGPEGLGLGLTASAGTDVEYDLDHVVLRVRDPESSFAAFSELGFEPDGGRLRVGDKAVTLEPGGGPEPERPLLNHLALLVDSADRPLEEARRRGLEIADVVDAANTYAVFVYGPDRIKLEYVEHKPSFSLV